jgi:hypothetical protein
MIEKMGLTRIVGKSKHPGLDQHDGHSVHSRHPRIPCAKGSKRQFQYTPPYR